MATRKRGKKAAPPQNYTRRRNPDELAGTKINVQEQLLRDADALVLETKPRGSRYTRSILIEWALLHYLEKHAKRRIPDTELQHLHEAG